MPRPSFSTHPWGVALSPLNVRFPLAVNVAASFHGSDLLPMDPKPAAAARTTSFAVGAIACLALSLLAALPGAGAATVVVTPTDLASWQLRHGSCGAPTTGNQTFEAGPASPPLGSGSLQISVGSNGDSFETFRHSGLNGTRLSDLTSLSYSSYTEVDGLGGQAIYLILAVSTTGGNVVDDQLFFEPVYQSGHNASIPAQGPLVATLWQSWDALRGGWWSVNGFAGAGPGSNVRTLADYAAAFPAASLVDGSSGGIRLSTGCGGGAWVGFVGNVDNVTLGNAVQTTTYDFEATAPPATGSTTTSASLSSTTDPGSDGSSTTSTTEVPFFPSWAALGVALLAGVGGAYFVLRRRLR